MTAQLRAFRVAMSATIEAATREDAVRIARALVLPNGIGDARFLSAHGGVTRLSVANVAAAGAAEVYESEDLPRLRADYGDSQGA